MADRQWKSGLTSDKLKKKDDKKGEFYKPPTERVSYIKKGVIKMFVPKDGKNKIRLIQPLEIEELGFYGLEMHFHRSVGEEGDPLFGDYLCLKRMKSILTPLYKDLNLSSECFNCAQQTSELWDENPDLAKTFYPDRRMWFLVHDLMSDDPKEILLWSCPWTLHEEILSRSSDEETSVYIDVSHPTKGVPISFERTGKGKLTKYVNVQIFKAKHPLDDSIIDELIEFRDALIIPGPETVREAFEGVGVATTPAADTDDTRQEVVESAPRADVPPECYKVEHGKWQDCDDCKFTVECSKPPEEKPTKPARPTRPTRAQAAEQEQTPVDKEGIKEKIRKAQQSRKQTTE